MKTYIGYIRENDICFRFHVQATEILEFDSVNSGIIESCHKITRSCTMSGFTGANQKHRNWFQRRSVLLQEQIRLFREFFTKWVNKIKVRVPTKISEKSSMIFPWLLQAKIQISRQKIPIFVFVFAAHASNCTQTDTDAHSHTDTHMIWSRPTGYSTDFTSNWTDSRSQNYTC